jgi:hypothetical protein
MLVSAEGLLKRGEKNKKLGEKSSWRQVPQLFSCLILKHT